MMVRLELVLRQPLSIEHHVVNGLRLERHPYVVLITTVLPHEIGRTEHISLEGRGNRMARPLVG